MAARQGRLYLFAVTVASTAVLLCGCATYRAPTVPVVSELSTSPKLVPVYVAYNDFHAELIVPTASVLANPGPTAIAIGRTPRRRWTGLGYGDSKFYQQQGIDPARVLDFFRAMFAPGNPAVVQVLELDDPLRDGGHPKLLLLSLPPGDFARMVRHVDESFQLQDGAPVFVATGRDGPEDAFFAARTPASAVHECNQWLGEVLGSAGVPHSYLLDTASVTLAADLVASGRAVRVPQHGATRATLETPIRSEGLPNGKQQLAAHPSQ